jgi:predicted nucleic acid-binding Zn finger protein
MIINISNEQKQITKHAKTRKEKKKSLSRMDKALALVKNVEKNLDGSFIVRSSSFLTSGRVYTVRPIDALGKLLTCTCPDFEHRQSNNTDGGGECKHIIAAKLYMSQNKDDGTGKLIKQVAAISARNEAAGRQALAKQYVDESYEWDGGF